MQKSLQRLAPDKTKASITRPMALLRDGIRENRTDLVKGLARVSVFVDTTLLVKCELRSNSMHISTQDLDFSCSDNETIPCSYDGNEMSVGFSVEHLTASLNNIEADEVVMSLSDPSRPGIISPSIEKENEKVLIIIMPMKV